MRKLLLVVFLFGCSQSERLPYPAPESANTYDGFFDIRGRIAVGQVPLAVEDSAFTIGGLPPDFLLTSNGYYPQYQMRRKAFAGWAGYADAQYVAARALSIQPVKGVRIDELEEAGIDPVALDLKRKIRTAIALSPTWQEFEAEHDVDGILIVEDSLGGTLYQADKSMKVLEGDVGQDWIDAAKKMFPQRDLPLPLYFTSSQLISGAKPTDINPRK